MNSVTIKPYRVDGVETGNPDITIHDPDEDGDIFIQVGTQTAYLDPSCARHLAITILKAADGNVA